MASDLALSGRKMRQLQARTGASLVLEGGASSIPLFGGERLAERVIKPSIGAIARASRFSAPPVGVGQPFGGPAFGPGPTTSAFDPRAPLGGSNLPDFGGVLCDDLAPGTVVRRLCEAAVGKAGDFVTGLLPGGDKSRPAGEGPCKPGQIRVRDHCVDFTAALPGGDPFTTTAGGVAVQGSFGLPAIQPAVESRTRRTCPTGMVLGRDNLCYPKQILSRRSKFRKWKAPKRPPISVRDAQAIRRAERAKGRVKELAKDVGFSVKKR